MLRVKERGQTTSWALAGCAVNATKSRQCDEKERQAARFDPLPDAV